MREESSDSESDVVLRHHNARQLVAATLPYLERITAVPVWLDA